MINTVKKILEGTKQGSDQIHGYDFRNVEQSTEIEFRKNVVKNFFPEGLAHTYYFEKISHHHSIPVMDREVELFLKRIPRDGVIVDVGGCWGWHWRWIWRSRPDVKVIIVDLVRENLAVARDFLKQDIDRNIFLLHGDATSLIFKDCMLDGYWSVQTLQHIPNFNCAVSEAYRVLKKGGIFWNYSLNRQRVSQFLFQLAGKSYHLDGQMGFHFYLARASNEQKLIVAQIFKNKVEERFTELLFRPEFGILFPGRESSLLGKIDRLFSSSFFFSKTARQRSFHTMKI